MNILITGASSQLADAIADELGEDHSLRLMDNVPLDRKGNFEVIQGSILDADDSARAVHEMDVLIHTGEPPSELPEDALEREQTILDLATRGTHVIFTAGVNAGIKKFIYASTLAIFHEYPEDIYISELWKPLPSPETVEMTKYLGELTCREFARANRVTVTALRLGELVRAEAVQGAAPNASWLDIRDAAQAFRCALSRDSSEQLAWQQRWDFYHICADIPNPRFLIDKACGIGYQPTHNFEAYYQ